MNRGWNNQRRAVRANAGAAWTPLTPGTLASWWDASAAGSIQEGADNPCEDTDQIYRAVDQSGNSNTLSQVDPTKQLTYRTDQQNGLPALVGTGANDSLANAADLIGAGNITVFAAFMAAGWGGTNAGVIVSNWYKFHYGILVTGTRMRVTSDGAGTWAYSAGASIAIGVPCVACVTRSSGGITNLYVNGAASGTADQSSGTPASAANTHVAARLTGDGAWNGHIYELGVYNSILTGGDLASLTAYLRDKWGI